jgi:hypothetical protein
MKSSSLPSPLGDRVAMAEQAGIDSFMGGWSAFF